MCFLLSQQKAKRTPSASFRVAGSCIRVSGDANMIGESLEESSDDLPEREGTGWLENDEEPGHGQGRWLDFWRLKATNMEGGADCIIQRSR